MQIYKFATKSKNTKFLPLLSAAKNTQKKSQNCITEKTSSQAEFTIKLEWEKRL